MPPKIRNGVHMRRDIVRDKREPTVSRDTDPTDAKWSALLTNLADAEFCDDNLPHAWFLLEGFGHVYSEGGKF